ncbi:YeiH family putative sulfate export transporter [Pseudaminobacter arsenicus]|uniref:YeiH family putative sulfate export transporter n=2 Tax=Borborobacter arsenicus TaxID=1851146 RepID=A0A432V0S8_9HYPH|nr:YeiH family protein [Pseudaminobacter arsenicus]RUM95695.1 YeiH family putative sulfate export transporter [Pseudaminobacter arsenicus]
MTAATSAVRKYMTSLPEAVTRHGPGFLVCATVGIAAQFLSDHYGAPAMLMALLLGIAFHFLAEEGRCVSGIDFTAKKVLRFGVALLGVRISVDLLLALGPGLIALLVLAIISTILFGLLGAKLLGRGWRLALLTGGSVAICGASAAMAIAAVLPKNQFSERNLIFTILSVTVLSTIAMIAYPLVTSTLGLDHRATGVFLGGTIHDVAQVVGAGFSVSEETGETATLIKLIRVTMLAPVVLVFSLAFRNMQSGEADTSKRPPLIPGFVVGFLVLAALNSFGLLPQMVVSTASDVSRWALLLGIAAVGMKTALKNIFDVGREAVILIVAETLFLAVFILVGMHYLG